MSSPAGILRELWGPESTFVLRMYLLLLAVFTLIRLLMLVQNHHLASDIPPEVLMRSFMVGLRFDLAVCSYLLIPVSLLLLLGTGGWAARLAAAALVLVVLAGWPELEHLHRSGMRFAPRLCRSHGTLGPLLLRGWREMNPAGLAGGLLLAGGGAAIIFRNARILAGRFPSSGDPRDHLLRVMGCTLLLVVMVFASRGGWGRFPLRWTDASFSGYPFADRLAGNGLFALGRGVWERFSLAP